MSRRPGYGAAATPARCSAWRPRCSPIFESRDVRSEALAAQVLLRGAVETERVSLEILKHLSGQLRRA
jgi:hypothetical protein